MTPLVKTLNSLGFFPVLGTVERAGGESSVVQIGAPKRCDHNNGVVVVYDDGGVPWIISVANITISQITALVRDHGLSDKPAYVPHSNDGGRFLRGHLPSVSAPS